MTGNNDYEMQYQKKIDKILGENNRMQGFYSFIDNRSISTVYNYLLHINGFLKYLNEKPLNKLTVDDFSGYLLQKKKNNKGENTTSSYKIGVYSALKKYGKYLVASRQLDHNPMDYIDRPKPIESKKTIEKREIGFLSQNEIPQYIQNIEKGVGTTRSKNRQKEWKERDMAIIMLFLNTGIRCSALMKIDVTDIDFQTKKLLVSDKEGNVNDYELSNELLNVISCWLSKRAEILLENNVDALFISNRRTRMNQGAIYKVVNKYAAGIEGKHITPHKLRATYGTQLYNATKDVYFVQQCMKHSNPKTTELYIRGVQSQTKAASEIMKKLTLQ